MKAIILAAGFGTRLRPFTSHTPKPLFTLSGKPLIDILIKQLQQAGVTSVFINAHHLFHKIDNFFSERQYSIPVHLRYEPEILGTGGAIKSFHKELGKEPFLVINSDIITDINIKDVYKFHLNHNYPVTLVLHDFAKFNKVSVNKKNFIADFSNEKTDKNSCGLTKLAFTGIHVIDTGIADLIPNTGYCDIIDTYKKLLLKGEKIKAFVARNHYWKDIGTPESYKEAIIENMGKQVFNLVFAENNKRQINIKSLEGDGSDRKWRRLFSENRSVIMVDHGIRRAFKRLEVDSFVSIGKHLYNKGIPVPEIYMYDKFSGVVFMEDLGDTNFQSIIINTEKSKKIISLYQNVIEKIVQMSISGAEGFNPLWPYQTYTYDKQFILEKECRYFVDAFLKGYLQLRLSYKNFIDDFNLIAKKALENSVKGFMHRDMQSRNIMVKKNNVYFIDFQGGRIGPVQYDLASLLIDPYVNLSWQTQQILIGFCIEKLSALLHIDAENFRSSYLYCSIARNLQILGAFGFLSKVKGKKYFERYIPAAVNSLKKNLSVVDTKELRSLKAMVSANLNF